MRTASHQDMSTAARKRPRPDRNGMAKSETIVPHTPATSTVAGKKSNKNFPTTCQKESPYNTHRNTSACQSTIQDRPLQTQPETVWRIQLHCSVWPVPSGPCMAVLPHGDAESEVRSPTSGAAVGGAAATPRQVQYRRALIVRRPVLSSGARDPHHVSGT